MRQRYRPFAIVASFVAAVAGIEVAVQGHDRDEPLVITQLVLEESRDIDRNVVEDIYRGLLTHTGRAGSVDFARVTAAIAHPFGLPTPGIVQVVDGDLTFGAVRAGETQESADTITIRRHRHQLLKPNQLRWSIHAKPDLVPSDAWAGNWRFAMTYRNGTTNNIVQTSAITGGIPAETPLGLSLLPDAARCRWSRSDTVLQVNCAAGLRIDACLVDLTGHFEIVRDGDRARGHGDWRRAGFGACGDVGNGTWTVDIDGERLDGEVEAEPFAPGLLTSFVTVPGFSSLIADGIAKTTADEPDSERACTRGGWHRFFRPNFADERECRHLVRSRRVWRR